MAAANERAGRRDRQRVEHLVEEAGHDEALGPRRMQAAALEVEALIFVDRANRGSVAALDVVVLDLQVGNRLGPRLVGELDVAVRLEGVGASGIGPHVDEPGVHRAGPVVDHALEQQVARGVAGRVILEGAEVEQLVAAAEVQRMQDAGRAATDEAAVGALTRRVTAEDRGRCVSVAPESTVDDCDASCHVAAPSCCTLQIAEASIALDDDLDHRCQHQRVGGRQGVLDERRVAVGAGPHDEAGENRGVGTVVPVHDHDRGVDLDVGVDDDRERVDGERIVHLGEEVGRGRRRRAEHRLATAIIGQATDVETTRHRAIDVHQPAVVDDDHCRGVGIGVEHRLHLRHGARHRQTPSPLKWKRSMSRSPMRL